MSIGIQCDLQPLTSTPIPTSCSESELSEIEVNVESISKEVSFSAQSDSSQVHSYWHTASANYTKIILNSSIIITIICLLLISGILNLVFAAPQK